MKRFVISLVVIIALFLIYAVINNHLPPSANNAISFAEKRIANMMKDPSSVKFDSVKFYQKGSSAGGVLSGYVCGYVNGKNSFNAYTGNQSFIVKISVSDNGKSAYYQDAFLDSMRPSTFTSQWMEHCKSNS